MDAVTYPEPKVVDFIQKSLIPLRVRSDEKPISDDFNVQWTPCLVTLDRDGKEHHRTVGFLPPDEFVGAMLLGMAKVHFDRNQFPEAISELEKLVAEHPSSDAVPEAIYLLGVNRYKQTHNAAPLKEAYQKLQAEYPSSEWTKRAYPYRLL